MSTEKEEKKEREWEDTIGPNEDSIPWSYVWLNKTDTL